MGINRGTLALRSYILIIVSAILAAPSFISAQSEGITITLQCPQHALNVRLYEGVIRAAILTTLDTSVYGDPKVSVKARLVRRDRVPRSTDPDSVLSGTTLTVNGIAVSASGALEFLDTCTYQYVFRATVNATDLTTGVPLRAVSDSRIEVSSTGNFRISSIAIPTPTPTPIAVVPPEEE